MKPYERFINRRYVKMFNHFLKEVVENEFENKYHQDIKLNLYGIKIKPNSKAYKSIPVEELLTPQATVIFFIDSENPQLNTSDFIETLLYREGRTFLMLQDSTWFDEPNKFQIKFVFNKRPLYPLDYVSEDSLNENKLPFDQKEKNGIKTRLFKESINSGELKWHFDKQDRKVKVVKSNNWMLQMDNDTPKILKEGQTIFIPKGVYHRVIKGSGDLIVKIKEY
jgi:hypothetical protein